MLCLYFSVVGISMMAVPYIIKVEMAMTLQVRHSSSSFRDSSSEVASSRWVNTAGVALFPWLTASASVGGLPSLNATSLCERLFSTMFTKGSISKSYIFPILDPTKSTKQQHQFTTYILTIWKSLHWDCFHKISGTKCWRNDLNFTKNINKNLNLSIR